MAHLMNMVRGSKKEISYLLPILGIGLIAGWLLVNREILFVEVLIAAILFFLLFKRPELALAIQVNGTIIYFYLLYKLGIQPIRPITGGFHVFLVLCYSLGGIYLVSKSRQRIRLNKIDLLFFTFFIWVFLSYFLFYTGSWSAYRKITFAPLLVIAPYLGIQFLSSEDRIRKFFDYCILSPVIMVIPSFYELLTNPTFAECGRFAPYMFEKGSNAPLFGLICGTALVLLFGKILSGHKKDKIKYFIVIIPLTFLFLRAGGRGPFVSLLIAILIILIIFMFESQTKLRMRAFLLILITSLIILAFYQLPESTLYAYRAIIESEQYFNPVSSIYQRTELYKTSFRDFLEHPLIGVGIGNSSGGIGFPHNILLEVLSELGILGLMLFLPMCYITIRTAVKFIREEKNKRLNLLMKLSLLLFVYHLLEAMFSGYITNQTVLFASIALISVLNKMGRSISYHEQGLMDKFSSSIKGKTF